MRKKFSFILIMILLLGLAAPLLGCSDNSEEKIDVNRTQLYVHSYNGGVGNKWLEAAKKRFEEKYAQVPFEDGKNGVQIMIDPSKVNGVAIYNSISNSTNEVLFNEFVNYNEWVAGGKFLDITDVVEEINEEDGNKSIESKIPDFQKEVLKKGEEDKYYAIPHYEAYRGIVYDIDLFENELLYFAKDRSLSDFITNIRQEKSAGPDGVLGNADDGLPATYVEFFELCTKMADKSITPFVWNGSNATYTTFMLYALMDAWSGIDEARLNYTFGVGADEGKNIARIVTGFSDGNPVIDNTPISERNGYLLKQLEGKYRAIQFHFNILNNQKFRDQDSVGNATFTNTQAQEKFVFSSADNKPIAMLVDGSFWETEAAVPLEELAGRGIDVKNRNFGWMPLPGVYDGAVTEQNGVRQTLSNYINAYAGINANIAEGKVELAKLFLKFCYTDAELNSFTAITGMKRGVNYVVTEESRAQMSKFYRNLLEIRDEADVYTLQSKSRLFVNNEMDFTDYALFWNGTYQGNDYRYPIDAQKEGKNNARIYFEGMKMTNDAWKEKYGQWILQG